MRYEFQEMFGAYEHALKRCNFLKANLSDAQADWNAFARALGEPFFKEVLDSGMARTLIYSPPGKLLLANFEWTRPNRPLKNVIELFEQGVCRVRNSLVHGEKFIGDEAQRSRDHQLLTDAMNILRMSRARHRGLAGQLDRADSLRL